MEPESTPETKSRRRKVPSQKMREISEQKTEKKPILAKTTKSTGEATTTTTKTTTIKTKVPTPEQTKTTTKVAKTTKSTTMKSTAAAAAVKTGMEEEEEESSTRATVETPSKKLKEVKTSPKTQGTSNGASLPMEDRTVIWRGKPALIKAEDEVLMIQNPETKAFFCFMGRCGGLASYDTEDMFQVHVSESHCKSGAKGGMAFQFWRWKVEKPLQCPDCNLRFDKEEKLVDHQCDKEVLQNAHLAGRSVGAGEALKVYYECSICGLRSTTESGKLNHERTHFEKRNFSGDSLSCKKCGFQATSESQLWIHEGQHTKDSKKVLDAPPTSQPAKRQKLMPTVSPITVIPSSKAPSPPDSPSSEEEELDKLTKKKKLSKENRRLKATSKYPECTTCGKVFFSQASLEKHPCAGASKSTAIKSQPSTSTTTTSATPATPSSTTPSSTTPSTPTTVPTPTTAPTPTTSSLANAILACKLCSKSFDSTKAFVHHSQTSHPLCDVCGQRFVGEDQLGEHLDDEHPICEICGQIFLDDETLEVHLDEAHPKCGICQETFVDDQELEDHTEQKHIVRGGGKAKKRSKAVLGQELTLSTIEEAEDDETLGGDEEEEGDDEEEAGDEDEDDDEDEGGDEAEDSDDAEETLKRKVAKKVTKKNALLTEASAVEGRGRERGGQRRSGGSKRGAKTSLAADITDKHKILEQKLVCDQCDEEFPSKATLYIHKVEIHL